MPSLVEPLTDESIAAARAAFRTLDQVEGAARRQLPFDVWDFLVGGSGAEDTLHDNTAAFDNWRFRPRVLTGMRSVNLSCELFGRGMAAPLLVAPFAPDALFHRDGYLAVAAACDAAGLTAVAPTSCSFTMEEVRSAGNAARFFQLPPTEPQVMHWLIERAEKAGFEALFVTVDQPVIGWRERSRASGFTFDRRLTGANFAVHGGPGSGSAPVLGADSRWLDWTWETLSSLLSRSPLPFVVKGVLTAEDARAAVQIGAAGVVVSNHGGRQLHSAPASLQQLPEVVEAISGRVPVLLDSGLRRGSDVVKALALGADAVLLGRAAAHGLAAGGAAGVLRTLELFIEEMTAVLALLGRNAPQLTREVLRPHRYDPPCVRCDRSADFSQSPSARERP
ncbi:alpha-hydroxy acid oxidase [Streptomyces sp. NPDC028722]|uniref:alpha-hydroxy acid oxidase n=1 Tax=Streptomyces sp. NPDC028722 TaxID=3155016 RepID=UPI0033D71C3C